MKLIRTWLLGLIGLFVLTSCGLFGPPEPYDQGDRYDPLVLDRPHPEKRRVAKDGGNRPLDYLFPWRLLRDRE